MRQLNTIFLEFVIDLIIHIVHVVFFQNLLYSIQIFKLLHYLLLIWKLSGEILYQTILLVERKYFGFLFVDLHCFNFILLSLAEFIFSFPRFRHTFSFYRQRAYWRFASLFSFSRRIQLVLLNCESLQLSRKVIYF